MWIRTVSTALAVAVLIVACGDNGGGAKSVAKPERTTTAASAPPTSLDPATTTSGGCTRIVIDPGHDLRANPATEPIGPGSPQRKIKDGGGTSGVATHVPEHVVNLQISLELRRQLKGRGYCVTMTRTKSSGLSMGNVARAQIANRAHAALFVRIHADGNTDHSRNGTSVLYPAFHRGWTDDILPASKTAAEVMQAELIKALGSRDNGIVARSDLTGFNWADVPAVLPELGFMSNPREDRLLTTPSYQRKAALGITRAIVRFAPPTP
jgi:N-acetylmuramoyl-L-alanine amidase